jgi:hypothetical protein
MADTLITYGTRTEFGSDSNLVSLASGTACGVGAVDNSGGQDAYVVDLTIVLASTGVSSTGTIIVYLIQSSVSTSSGFTDGISPTGTSVGGSIKNAIVVATLNANANSQTVAATFRLPVPDPSKYWSLVISNGSGATLASSGHSVFYTAIKYTTA